MRLPLTLALALFTATASAASGIRLVNEAGLPAASIRQLQADYEHWALKVYRYHHVVAPTPARIVISRQVDIGYYLEPSVYLPVDEDPTEMLETFVHELAHHATGHESTFFFKEGIATHTAEALFAEQGQRIEGWPQYGISTDAWVNLFLQRGQLPPLRVLLEKSGYDGSSREADFRSWQTYLIAASFIGWLIEHEGYDTFRNVFWEETLGERHAEWERRWLASIRQQGLPPFDVAQALPQTARYRDYARRLGIS
ncbi:MAG: hypothetical protein V4650_06525 [Pseudomonadota bacterium]